jgi:hypothetical protein
MNNLSKALKAKVDELTGGNHNDFYNSINGRFFKIVPCGDASLPYVVFYLINDAPDWNFTSDFENVLIQMNIYSDEDSASEIEDIYTKMKALFDWCTLTITDTIHVYMRRVRARIMYDEEYKKYYYVVDYEILTQKYRS